MKSKNYISSSLMSKLLVLVAGLSLAGCAGTDTNNEYVPVATPTVDYVETLDVYSAPHKDSFLNQLAMNYRSYAIYNARTSMYPEIGELFAQKAVAAFSGELPFPETLQNWPIEDEQASFEVYTAYNELIDQLKNDASLTNPELAAEAQAKYDCWISALASGQYATADECRTRFQKAINVLKDCENGKVISGGTTVTETVETTSNVSGEVSVALEQDVQPEKQEQFYPDTRNMRSMNSSSHAREGVIIVNNVNVPEHLINPVPVQPLVFNQNIYGGDKTITDSNNKTKTVTDSNNKTVTDSNNTESLSDTDGNLDDNCIGASLPECQNVTEPIPVVSEEYISREEFINMMMAMRAELAAINARLDKIELATNDKTIIKVQQIPLEPQQHIMEEVLEIQFDFDKAVVKPEYDELIRQLVGATQNNKNIKVSVVGHTDTVGTKSYNYALGGRRAEAVQQMLIKYGIPASQIVAVSAGEEGLKVPTPDNVRNAENRRVRVVKETSYTEMAPAEPVNIEVGEFSETVCGEYGCQN